MNEIGMEIESAQLLRKENKSKHASGGSYQKPLKSFGDLTFATQYCTGFAINLSANSPPVSCSTLEDPIYLAGGLNMYTFVENDSINYTDLTGLKRKGFYSCIKAMEVLTKAKYSPGDDDLRHCYASCMIATNCPGGTLGSALVGVLKEIKDLFGSGTAEIRDLVHDAMGNIYASQGIHKSIKGKMSKDCCNVKKGECSKCCECLKKGGFFIKRSEK